MPPRPGACCGTRASCHDAGQPPGRGDGGNAAGRPGGLPPIARRLPHRDRARPAGGKHDGKAGRPGRGRGRHGARARPCYACLAARVPGVHVVGVEQDGRVAALARENIAANGFPLATVDTCDVLDLAPGPRFDHAMANPPWHDPAGPASPSPGRDAAKRARPGLLPAWCAALARAVCPGGSLTVLVPAALVDQALGALAQAGCGDPHLLPLWPRAGQDAKLLLLRGVRAGPRARPYPARAGPARGPRLLGGRPCHPMGGRGAALALT